MTDPAMALAAKSFLAHAGSWFGLTAKYCSPVPCEYLSSGDSLYVLNDSPSGWKCAQGRRTVGIEQYEHDPSDEHWGFASWNDFFTRRRLDGRSN